MNHGSNPTTTTADPLPKPERVTVVNPMPLTGEIIAGKYVMERVIGRGGMGVVLAARHCLLQQRVAIKLLLPDATMSEELEARFLREAQAVAQLRSEHVARVMDVGTLESGSPFMVMEYLEGEDLGELLSDRKTLPVDEAVDFMLQAFDAVAEAHAKGLVHRDLKPSNLFCTVGSDGFPLIKVLDFGISKPVADTDASLTSTGAVMGSPIYMSPEQVRSSRSIDVRSDIWSLGVVLYELLTGRPPFTGQTIGEVFASILETTPTPPRQWVPSIPEAVEQAIMACLQRDVTLRMPDVGVLATALAPFASPRIQPLVERIAGVVQFAGAASRGSVLISSGSISPSGRNQGVMALPNDRGATFIQWGQTGALQSRISRPMRGLAALGIGAALLCGIAGWRLGVHTPSAAQDAWATKEAITSPMSPTPAAQPQDATPTPALPAVVAQSAVDTTRPGAPGADNARGASRSETKGVERAETKSADSKGATKDAKSESRESRDSHDSKGSKSKDAKESKDVKDTKDTKEPKDGKAVAATLVAAEKPVDLGLDGRE